MIVGLLLEIEADSNALGDVFGIALLAALSRDYNEIFRPLLDHGADKSAREVAPRPSSR